MNQDNFEAGHAAAAAPIPFQSVHLSGGRLDYLEGGVAPILVDRVAESFSAGFLFAGKHKKGGDCRLSDTPLIRAEELTPGDIAILPQGCELHARFEVDAPIHAMAIEWPAAEIERLAEVSLRELSAIRPVARIQDPLIALLFETLRSEFATLGASSRLMADSAMVLIFDRITALRGTPARKERAKGGLAPRHLKLVTSYIMDNLSKNVTLAELAALTDLSQVHFSRAFKQSVGCPPHRWQLAQRIALAQRLLRETSMPIGHIRLACGFENAPHFSIIFRRHARLGPREWRRCHQS